MSRNRNKHIITAAMVSAGVIFLTSLSACSKTSSSEALISEAKQYQQKGDSKAAIIQLKNALQKNPDDAEARYLLGNIYNDTGDALSAEKELRKAASLGVDANKTKPGIAKSLLAQGQFQKVLDETQTAPTAKVEADIASLRGNAYLSLGKVREAKESFELALKDNADAPEALVGLARCALFEKDMETATRLADQAAAKNPKNVGVWLFKGDIQRAQGKADAALAAYDEALKVRSGHPMALLAKASVEIGIRKFTEAKADIEAARKSSPENLSVIYTQALLDFSQAKYAAAQESLQQILRVAPEHMPSIFLAGAVQYALGATQQAEQNLKKYLDKNPENLYARRLLISALLKNNQQQQAINVLAPALKGPQQDHELLMLAGQTYMQARDFTKANEYFERANALSPQNAAVHTAMGIAKLQQGENAAAIEELQKANALDAKSPQAGLLLAMTHLRLKEYDKALVALHTLEKEQPDNPLLYNLEGGALLGKNDIAAARKSFEKAVSIQANFLPAVTNLANLDVRDKKPDVAKKRFEDVLAKDGKNIQAMVALSNIALASGKNDEAKTWLDRARTADPQAVQPAQLLITYYLRNGDKQAALALANELAKITPGNADFLDILAQTQFATGDKAGALNTYVKLAVLLPDAAPVQMRIASVYMADKNEAAAAEALKKALRQTPNYAEAQIALSALETQRGNYDEALALARQVQKQQDKSPLGYAMEGDVLMGQKKPALAVKAYEQAAAINNTDVVTIKLHGALLQAGQKGDAEARVNQWLKSHPDDTRVRTYLAEIGIMTQQYKTAIEHLQAVLKIEPNNPAALNNLAWAYDQEKDPRALGLAEKAYQLVPDNASILDTLGWMLVNQGNTKRGVPLLQKAASLAPNSAEIHYRYVLALVKSGDKATARTELEKLLASGQPFSKTEEAKSLMKQL